MADISSIENLFPDGTLLNELYQLVVRGDTAGLQSRLGELSNAMEYLTALKWYGPEQLSLLMVAALHGHDPIVRLLLTCDPAKEQLKLRGAILNKNQTVMEDVSALYCACYRGHFNVARTLIEVGKADVNEDSLNLPYYPLLLNATMNNRLDIVRFLLDNRYADVNETKSLDHRQLTALMCAVCSGHTSLAQHLIDAGADVKYRSPGLPWHSRTALMLTVKNDQLDSFMLLYHRGATMDDSSLRQMVKHKSYSILRFLLNESLVTPDQLELQAASSLCRSSLIEDMESWLEFLRISLQYRQRTGQRKICPPPLSIYDYRQECQTVDELKRIVDDRNRILIEFLLIQDRVESSRQEPRGIQLLEAYSLMLVEKKRFETCLDLCHHHFDLTEQSDAGPSLHLFIWLFCAMLSSDHCLPVDRFLRVANLIFKESYLKDTGRSLINALCLVILAAKMLQKEETTSDDRRSICKWVQKLCRHDFKMLTGQTLLHLCVNEKTNDSLTFRNATINTHIKFPNEVALRLLLTHGSRWLDIDVMDWEGSTPLHIACRGGSSPTIIELLMHHGCHLDSVDARGRTPISYTERESIITLLTPQSNVNQLKCLCARFIATKDLKGSLMDLLPTDLKKFVLLHDTRRS